MVAAVVAAELAGGEVDGQAAVAGVAAVVAALGALDLDVARPPGGDAEAEGLVDEHRHGASGGLGAAARRWGARWRPARGRSGAAGSRGPGARWGARGRRRG